MKILRLELRAFGPFTDEVLDLSAGEHGLHLILGPNEAGKSSALRALRNFFYGIPSRSNDNFLHPHPQMRIGAALRAADGRLLELVRRKGNTKTLRDANDDEAIDEAFLTKLLGGLDETSFCRRHGLGYDDLVHGGRDLVTGGGDLGHSLFAAASGIANLSAAQAALAAEAEKLFAPSARVREINRAVADYQQLQKEIKESLLPTARWREIDKALRDALDERQAVSEAIQSKTSRAALLKRIASAIPLAARRRQTLTDLEPLADAPQLSEEFSQQRQQATIAVEVAAKKAEREKEEIARLERSLADSPSPDAVLKHAQAIAQLQQRLGSHRKAMDDRKVRVAEERAAQTAAKAKLGELGRTDLALGQAEQLRLTADQRVRIQNLGNEKSKLVERVDNSHTQHTELQQRLDEVARQLDALPPSRSAESLRQALAQAREAGPLEKQLAQLQSRERDASEEIRIALGRLRGWSNGVEELQQLALPPSETLDRYQEAFDGAQQRIAAIEQRLVDDEQEAEQRLDEQIDGLRRAQDVPTEEDLAAARQRRQRGWELVREQLAGGKPMALELAGFLEPAGGTSDLAEAVAAAITQADEIADRLRREAAQVAEKAERLARRAALERRLKNSREQLAKLRDELAGEQRAWQSEWSPLGIEPRTPREMHAWLRQARELCDAARDQRSQQREIERLETTLAEHAQRLSAAMTISGAANVAPSIAQLLRAAEALLQAIETEDLRRQQLAREREQLRRDVATSAKQVDASTQALSTWADDWANATRVLQLRKGAEPAEASAAVEASKALMDHLKEADSLAHRIKGIDKDSEQFQDDIRHICALAAPQLADQPAEQAVAALADLLAAAQQVATRRKQAEEQLQATRKRCATAEQEQQTAAAMLKALCSEARCDSPEQLPEAERRAQKRRELATALAEQEDRLLELGAGDPVAEFVASLAQHDAAAVAVESQQLEQALNELREKLSSLDQSIGQQQVLFAQMDGNARAAEARQSAEQLLAKIRGDAEHYARLRLAAVVLERSIERYREQHQGPVLQRASDLFATLTLGRFEALRADLDDSGAPVLVGVRSGGREAVRVEGMSDGTCDQLYLALRLASLEMDLASSREPLPLVVDDILIKFDDDRSAAALKVLAAISEKTQVIMFTHHEHLVRLAKETLDDDVLYSHSLDSRRQLAIATS